MRGLSLLLLLAAPLLSAASIDSKIRQTNSKIKHEESTYQRTHSQFRKSAAAIKREERNLKRYAEKLAQLGRLIESKRENYEAAEKELTGVKERYEALLKQRETTQKELSRLMAKQLSLHLILKQKAYGDADALMRAKMFESLSRLTQLELGDVRKELFTLSDTQEELTTTMQQLESTILSVDKKREEVRDIKRKHEATITSLIKRKSDYQKALEEAYEKKMALRKTLEKLHIMKEEAIKQKKARQRAEQAKADGTQQLSATKVKKYSSLYAKVKTKKYRGPKALAPLDGYRVVKRFGPYTDPIYKIKIFNESVSLKPKKPNSGVRAVLNAKVVLTKNSPLLGNFVILEHGDGLHTIYAHLDKIAPTLKKGKRIKKGHLIGRVSDELTFEVTQKNYHINPLEMIP